MTLTKDLFRSLIFNILSISFPEAAALAVTIERAARSAGIAFITKIVKAHGGRATPRELLDVLPESAPSR
jgi:hypothetical protein